MFERSTSDARQEPATHRCIAGRNCIASTTINEERLPALTENPNTLCEPCHDRIQTAIRQLPEDWQKLSAALGDKTSNTTTPAVASTPTPAIPISATRAALMADIVEIADRAASIIANRLNTEHTSGRRNTAPPVIIDGKPTKPQPNTPAWTAEAAVKPDALQALRAHIAIIEPCINELALAPAETFAVWDTAGEDNGEPTVRDDNGEPIRARGRIFTDITGLQIALDLTNAHHRTRVHLGLAKLRHKYGFPCPRCGSDVGRDDGTTIVDCRNPACKASWTEREFKFLQGLELEGREKDITKWLLTEAYERLDNLTALIAELEADERFNQSEAVKLIIGAVKPTLAGHLKPKDREIGTGKAATRARQLEEDNWSWRNESPYRPPKRKKPKPKPPPETTYAASSLALDTPIQLAQQGETREKRCPDCNEIHAGECP